MSQQQIMTNWKTDPMAAFVAYVGSPEFKKTAFRDQNKSRLSQESVTVYKAMFSRFVKFITQRQRDLFNVDSDDIYAYLTQTYETESGLKFVLESEIQYRYLRLLERVFTYLDRLPRPTDHLLFGHLKEQYKLRGRNQQTVVLTEDEIQSFLVALPYPSTPERTDRQNANWKKIRDRNLQCVVLGAGLTVAEVITLKLSDLDDALQMDGTWKLTIEACFSTDGHNNYDVSHVTFLHARFVSELTEWVKLRETVHPESELLFPNTDGTYLDKATVYRQIRKTFERAGIDLPRRGGRTLRNTFAVNELLAGTDTEELKEKLGLYEERSMKIYVKAAGQETL